MTIPKKIHQVWYGDLKNFPHEQVMTMVEFAHKHGWEYNMWKERDLISLPMSNHMKEMAWWYYKHGFMSAPSNIYRAAILFWYGGWYVDADVSMIDGETFDHHPMHDSPFVVVEGVVPSKRFDLGDFPRVINGIMGAREAHTISAKLIERLDELPLTDEALIPSWDSTGGSLLSDVMKDANRLSYRLIHRSAFYHGKIRGDERFVEPRMMHHHDGAIHKYDRTGKVLDGE